MSDAPALAEILARPGVIRILALLNTDGEQARIVGGAVRNALIGLPIADIDIATTASPDTVIERARAAGIHSVPTGYEHGTVTLVIDGIPHEITTLREDIETDGRRAVVRFGRDFRADAFRRDFTINALSAGPDGRIHDYASGMADIAARRVRFIGDADARLREDYLRILRFFRFSAAYGDGGLDAEGYAAVIRNRAGLAQLSRERIRQELIKLLVAPQAVPVIRRMDEAQVLEPSLNGPANVARLAALAALETRFALPADPVRRLFALTIETPADIERLRDALRLTNREVDRIARCLCAALAAPIAEDQQRVLLYRLGPDLYRDVLLLFSASTGDDIADALALPERWSAPQFRLSGKDVLALGVAKGPEVGRALAELEAAWIAAGMPAEEAAQRRILAQSLSAR